MNKVIIKLITLLLMALSMGEANAQATHSATASQKATATLASVCSLAAQNVNFGMISLPVGTQSATSSMSVQCTKGSSYTISLAYGGVYGTTSQNVSATYNLTGYTSGNGYTYQICNYTATYDGTSYTKSVGNNGNAPWGYCPTTSGTKVISTASVYSYGKMIGASKGDNIAYSIQVPGNSSQVWNVGNYNYTATGTGSSQSIPVIATLVPAQTTNNYPSADSYLDTVTATVTY